MLKQIHDELDAAVFDAYGWPHDLSDEEILERLVALNHERAEEEQRGLIRWLRPEFQNLAGGKSSVRTGSGRWHQGNRLGSSNLRAGMEALTSKVLRQDNIGGQADAREWRSGLDFHGLSIVAVT